MVDLFLASSHHRRVLDGLQPAAHDRPAARVAGVSMLEKSLKETRPGYKEYSETTSGFIR
jgi:hypothetical protein